MGSFIMIFSYFIYLYYYIYFWIILFFFFKNLEVTITTDHFDDIGE